MDAPNLNHLWADLLVEELVRCGVDFFCLAPGSRSTPLTTAVARHPTARHVMHFDERGTAFFALGYGRATGRPAAWITTSGTAVANGLPAVVEAATDCVPLLLLTADRPPELRQSGANQTIDQVKLFGDYIRWFFDLPVPTLEIDPAMVLTTVDQAVNRATRSPRGPVHLNCMFREPLAPTDDECDFGAYLGGLKSWEEERGPFTRYAGSEQAAPEEDIAALAAALAGVQRGLVVAGSLAEPEEGEAVLRLAERLGWPLLPDVTSPLRLGHEAAKSVVAHYDLLLADEAFAAGHAPEAVVHVGGRPTSKRLLQLLDRCRPRPCAVVRLDPFRFDPNHQVTHRFEAGVAGFCEAMTTKIEAQADPGWLAGWREASERAAARLEDFFEGEEALSEPLVARIVVRELPAGHGLCLASSMPIRDVDTFAPADGASPRVAANRGASGIDGTVATAAGFATGLGAPVTLLIGDLALLHDLNSLALLRDLAAPLVLVVLNNDGGGIFHFLPIARQADVFEPFFGTPHGLTFESIAATFGVGYFRALDRAGFIDAYRTACRRDTATLIEVKTDREENLALHRRLLGN